MGNNPCSLLQVNKYDLINQSISIEINIREFLNFSLSIISCRILLVSFVVKVDEMSDIL